MASMDHTIDHQEDGARGAFFIAGENGAHLASMSYSRANESLVIIDHTEVDPSLSGQGVGRRLLNALVEWARGTGTRVMPLCPYAKAQFEKDASLRDVLM